MFNFLWGRFRLAPFLEYVMKRILLILLILSFAGATVFAATFGKTDRGGSANAYYDQIRGGYASPTADGNATSMTGYLGLWAEGEKVKFALYDANDRSLIASTAESSAGGAIGWHTLDFASEQPVYDANNYLLAMWSDSEVYFWWDTTAGVTYPSDDETYGTWPDPVGTTTGVTYSIYCTYTPTSSTTAGTRSRYSNGYRSSYRNRYN
jgi:hypothetical protein